MRLRTGICEPCRGEPCQSWHGCAGITRPVTGAARHSSAHRRGFSLLELMVVMWALGMALAVGTVMMVAMFRADRAGGATNTRLNARTELADQFRRDVARADDAPDRVGDTPASPTTLILAMPDGTYIFYLWSDDTLIRTERLGDTFTRRPVSVGGASAVEFVRDDRPGVVTLRLTESPAHGPARRSEVSAALGGDWR